MTPTEQKEWELFAKTHTPAELDLLDQSAAFAHGMRAGASNLAVLEARIEMIGELLERSIGHGTRRMKDQWMREALELTGRKPSNKPSRK